MSVKIYHNPRCSKSRETLALLEEKGVEHEVIKYLDEPPSKTRLKKILKLLGMKPLELIRKGSPIYKELEIGSKDYKVDELIQMMVENPILIERPIVVKGDEKAVLGRPPENVEIFFPRKKPAAKKKPAATKKPTATKKPAAPKKPVAKKPAAKKTAAKK